MTEAPRRNHRPLLILAALIVMGLVIGIWQPVDLDQLLATGERVGTNPLFIAAVLVTMAVLFSFGLPGSFGLWLIAPFNPPLLATVLLVSASTAGAAGAYAVAGRLGRDWQPTGLSGRIFSLLEERADLLTQMALRMLPGFPHSVINFAGGVLKLPIVVFLIAAVVGLAVKWGVYASAIYGITDALEDDRAIDLAVLWPLIVLVILALAGAWMQRRISRR